MRPVRAVSVLRLTSTGLGAVLCVEFFGVGVVYRVRGMKVGVAWISGLVIEGYSMK